MYGRLAPYIQQEIYKQRWERLTPLQEQTAKVIFDTGESLVVSSGTATGKTEAVMFPLLTDLENRPADGIRILYFSPTKALINDQYRRLSKLTAGGTAQVVRYHSDVGSQKKKQLEAMENLIVMLTPESLESLLISEPGLLRRRMESLEYIVIDEMHYFMESERGIQLLCVMERLQSLIGRVPRRVGLSATIGDASIACHWLSSDTEYKVRYVTGIEQKKAFRVLLDGYEEETEACRRLYQLTRGRRSLIFFRTKKELEETACRLGKEQPVYIHHAGLTAEERKDTEEALRSSIRPVTVASTSTLELGIDIGGLERVLHMGAPFRVTSFLQRLGRSGRRGAPSEMAILVKLEKDPLHWEVLLAAAIVRLYTEKRWLETPMPVRKPFQIVFQQMLAIVKEYGEVAPEELRSRILEMKAFSSIESSEYELLYQDMLRTDMLELSEAGGLLLGMQGELLVNSREFYAVFIGMEEYTVYYGKEAIGRCYRTMQPGDRLLIAGRAWEVESIDQSARELYVRESQGSGQMIAYSTRGLEIDREVYRMILNTLESKTEYPWMTAPVRAALEEDRQYYAGVPKEERYITKDGWQKSTVTTGKFTRYLPEALKAKEMESQMGRGRPLEDQIYEWKRRWKV